MAKKWKGQTTIGLMAGVEFGADFFNPWRVRKAEDDFLKGAADFIIVMGLLNIESLTANFLNSLKDRYGAKEALKMAKASRKYVNEFCEKQIKQILEDVLPPLAESDGETIKYWVFPVPLFEMKHDDFGIAAYIYENLTRASKEKTGKDEYIRVCSEDELVEIEDNVPIRTLGIVMPTVSFFRSKIISGPIEREIVYRQLSSVNRQLPMLYIAGGFAASINELNPRAIPESRPYVSIPSLGIKLRETVLQNTLGYAILRLCSKRNNRAEYEVSFYPLSDAVELECKHAERQLDLLANESQKRVAKAIVEKILVGTKITLGKIQNATGFSREKIAKAIKGIKRARVQMGDLDLGEIKSPYRIIPKTKKDLSQYREGDVRSRTHLVMACSHFADVGTDYDFFERDIPALLVEKNVDELDIVGDVIEGNKYSQALKRELIDRFSSPQQQQRLAGFKFAVVLYDAFVKRYEKSGDREKALVDVYMIYGNHDDIEKEPPLRLCHEILTRVLTLRLYKYFAKKGPVDYLELSRLVHRKIRLLDNPSLHDDVGMLHEYSQSAEQSTGKVQRAIKQFLALDPEIATLLLLLANHHEQNFSVIRIGDRTITAAHVGTLKRFYSFESKRSKISEFGVAVIKRTFKGDTLVCIDHQFVPSRIEFSMKDAQKFHEDNLNRGIGYERQLEDEEEEIKKLSGN